ncbi:MAG: hypothetical protein QNJ36_08775 [Calothrix sp. MO_167.B42]|nr:hypothetical protein [Calothrix sp. MO_167.B42]
MINTSDKSGSNTPSHTSKHHGTFWLVCSLILSAIYSYLALQIAFSSEYVVQDDARQHVFWMLRFLDPDLFPNDLIANYFQSVAPVGYSNLYHLLASLGINPLLFNKILPSIIALISTAYCFGICLQIFPVPFAGFMATVMLNQNLWVKDDLVSATPRAFVYPLFFAFLYYLLRRSLLFCLIAIALLGVFYPQMVFICAGILILRLLIWERGRLQFSPSRHDYLFCAAGVGVGILVLLPYAFKSSEFAPVITLAEARQLPEFFSGGRSQFFNGNPWYYFLGGRSGIFPRFFWTPITLYLSALLPILLLVRSHVPLLRKLTREIVLLLQIVLASFFMFFAAHALLFKLHLPSRYTGHSLRIVVAISAAIVLAIILDTVLSTKFVQNKIYGYIQRICVLGFIFILIILLLFYYPLLLNKFPKTSYKVGNFPQLYEFLQKQPQDTLIASIAEESNNLPTFSQRSILVGREYAIPYHLGYYNEFRQRMIELIQAHYSPNLEDVTKFINKYGIDLWMLESGAFTADYIQNNTWLKQYFYSKLTEDELVKLTNNIFKNLQQGNIPALSKVVTNCIVAEIENYMVLDAKCITQTKP